MARILEKTLSLGHEAAAGIMLVQKDDPGMIFFDCGKQFVRLEAKQANVDSSVAGSFPPSLHTAPMQRPL
jgi:hypothetical protein